VATGSRRGGALIGGGPATVGARTRDAAWRGEVTARALRRWRREGGGHGQERVAAGGRASEREWVGGAGGLTFALRWCAAACRSRRVGLGWRARSRSLVSRVGKGCRGDGADRQE
jgi:hypothetical protein